ncbi:MAG: nucleotidyltransferase family protein [Deltaproteobacteria bacterium]|nr:nucleotidyltransferase family protein [Deltaproteobacteria bacterium]
MKPNPQHVVLFHHFRRFLKAAAEEGIDAAPLKGAHLITGVYPEGEDRGQLADVDFLVRPRDWERALRLLPKLGFEERVLPSWHPPERKTHEAGFNLDLGGGRRILFEVHRHLLEPSRFPIDHEGIWARSVVSEFDGVPCRRLAAEDHFVFGALHEVAHRLQTLAKTVRDLELLVSRGGADLRVVIARANEWRVRRIIWLFLSLIEDRAPHLGAGALTGSVAPSPPVRIALRLLVPDERGTRLTSFHHRIQAALLWPWLFDDIRSVVRLVAHHPLFTPH